MVDTTIEEFVYEATKQAEAGLEKAGYRSCQEGQHSIKFELTTTAQTGKGGVIYLTFASVAGKSTETNTQKITLMAKKDVPITFA